MSRLLSPLSYGPGTEKYHPKSVAIFTSLVQRGNNLSRTRTSCKLQLFDNFISLYFDFYLEEIIICNNLYQNFSYGFAFQFHAH